MTESQTQEMSNDIITKIKGKVRKNPNSYYKVEISAAFVGRMWGYNGIGVYKKIKGKAKEAILFRTTENTK